MWYQSKDRSARLEAGGCVVTATPPFPGRHWTVAAMQGKVRVAAAVIDRRTAPSAHQDAVRVHRALPAAFWLFWQP